MSKLSLDRLTSSFGFQAAFNNVLEKIENEFSNKVLYRDSPLGTTNEMKNDLDMAGHDVMNVNSVSASSFRVNGVDLDEQVDTLIADLNSVPAETMGYRDEALAAKVAAESARDTAVSSVGDAAYYASLAATEADDAEDSANAAALSASQALSEKQLAAVFSGNAAQSALDALGHSQVAEGAKLVCQDFADQASDSADAAELAAITAANDAAAATSASLTASVQLLVDEAEVYASDAQGARDLASTYASVAVAAKDVAITKANESAAYASSISGDATDAANAADEAQAAQAECEAIRDGLQTASTHSHDNKPFLDELNSKTIAGYNVIRSQNLPPVGDYNQGTFCIVDAYEPKKLYLNVGLWWIAIPQTDSVYGKITKFDDVKLLWRYEDGGQRSAVGPDPEWSYSSHQYTEDGVVVGSTDPGFDIGVNDPVPAIHGDKGVWCGPSYSNLFSSGAEDFVTGFTTIRSSKTGITSDGFSVFTASESNVNGFSIVSNTISTAPGVYSLSMRVKKSTQRYILCNVINAALTAGTRVYFDLENVVVHSTSTFGTGGPVYTAADIIQIDGGFIFSITYDTNGEGALRFSYNGNIIAPGNLACTVNDVLYVSQPQYTATTTPMPYVPPGTTVASAAGTSGGNGIGFDMALEPSGVELVYNGTFDTNVDGWTAVSGATLTNTSSRLEINSSALSGAEQRFSTIVGAKYKVRITLVSTSAGSNLRIMDKGVGIGVAIIETPNLTPGVYEYTITALSGITSVYLRNSTTSTCVSVWDNISVQRLSSPLMRCFEKPETDGIELVTNGGFNSDVSGWSAQFGALSFNSGKAKLLADSALSYVLAYQAITTEIGKTYRLELDGFQQTSTYITVRVGTTIGGSTLVNETFSTGGSRLFINTFVATSTTTYISVLGTGTESKFIEFDNVSLQKLKPATCTVAAEVTMGVGSGDYSGNVPIIGVWNTTDSILYTRNGLGRIVQSYDVTSAVPLGGAWSRNEHHIKIVQTNADGTQFRVGNKKIGIDSAIQWGTWSNFDGSFNPLTHLRLAYGNTVPLWVRRVMVSNKGGMTDADILTRMEV